jgi:transcriptional accessory protein Tex/SPT6
VKPGQEVQVKVLSVDPAQRRISLSLKAAQAKEPEPVAEEPEPEPEVPAKPPRPRTTPLRGGTGSSTGQLFPMPKPPSADQKG